MCLCVSSWKIGLTLGFFFEQLEMTQWFLTLPSPISPKEQFKGPDPKLINKSCTVMFTIPTTYSFFPVCAAATRGSSSWVMGFYIFFCSSLSLFVKGPGVKLKSNLCCVVYKVFQGHLFICSVHRLNTLFINQHWPLMCLKRVWKMYHPQPWGSLREACTLSYEQKSKGL